MDHKVIYITSLNSSSELLTNPDPKAHISTRAPCLLEAMLLVNKESYAAMLLVNKESYAFINQFSIYSKQARGGSLARIESQFHPAAREVKWKE